MLLRAILLSCFALPMISCEDQNLDESNKYQEEFTGITETDYYGQLIGEVDSTDWDLPDSSNTDGLPVDYAFNPAYPNPTSWSVALRFPLPVSSSTSLVIITAGGDTVVQLVKGMLPAGFHQVRWSLQDNNGVRVPAAIYRAVLQAGDYRSHGDIQVDDLNPDPDAFSGITETDMHGFLSGAIDSTDWDLPDSSGNGGIPTSYGFYPAFPNPANERVALKFQLPVQSLTSIVILATVDDTIRHLVQEYMESGTHWIAWDLLDADSIRVPQAIYRAVLQAGDYQSHGDILVLD